MTRRNHNNLTDKWQVFADAYLVDKDLNATKAYKLAYPKAAQRSAEVEAAKLLRKPEVAVYIDKAQKARSKRTQINADYVLNRLVEIDQMDVLDIIEDDGSLKAISEWPKVWRQYLGGMDLAEFWEGRGDDRQMIGVLKKIKWPDKTKNLELLGKHVNVQAFSEHREVKVTLQSLIDELVE
ncbi:terminase small subunit [Microbulbifer sp. GL-2]|uniref:terminase small subunit n=1 Tax=Microbulbifer sp. GL-2 TaxID=2591606 RepID=UPI0011659E62|nr:terminase small subunit [Microbulbifer sp. GL-2]BBM03794.1 terminase [Microbulbifer sp. GL-2]